MILRQQILHRSVKTEMRESILNTQQSSGLKASYVGFNINDTNRVDNLKAKLFDLPKGNKIKYLNIIERIKAVINLSFLYRMVYDSNHWTV